MLNPVGSVDASYILAHFSNTSLGTIYTGIGGCPGKMTRWECQNYVQESIINSSRLGIPISVIGETLTGGTAYGTIFPQPVLHGASFNLELITAMGKSIARQARLGGASFAHSFRTVPCLFFAPELPPCSSHCDPFAGVDRGLSPVLQVDTDARFGRFEEVLLCTSVFTHR